MKYLLALLLLVVSFGARAQILIPNAESQWAPALSPTSQDKLFIVQPEQAGLQRYSLLSFSQLAQSGVLNLGGSSPPASNAATGFITISANTLPPGTGPIFGLGNFAPPGVGPFIKGWASFTDAYGVHYIPYF